MINKDVNDFVVYSPDTSIKIIVHGIEDYNYFYNKIKSLYKISKDSTKNECNWYIRIKTCDSFSLSDHIRNEGTPHHLEHGEMSNIYIDGGVVNIWKDDEFFLRKNSNDIFIESINWEVMYQILRKALRQIFTYELENKGGYRLHASSCSDEKGRGLAFIGDKGAGKTTLLLSHLAYQNFNYITNDVLEVRFHNDKIVTSGWPTICLIGKGTLDAIDKYSHLVKNKSWDDNRKLGVEYSLIEETFQTKIEVDIELEKVFFTSLSLDIKDTVIEELNTNIGRELLKENTIKDSEDPDHPDWLLLRENAISTNDFSDSLNKLRYFKVSVGNDLELATSKIVNL